MSLSVCLSGASLSVCQLISRSISLPIIRFVVLSLFCHEGCRTYKGPSTYKIGQINI